MAQKFIILAGIALINFSISCNRQSNSKSGGQSGEESQLVEIVQDRENIRHAKREAEAVRARSAKFNQHLSKNSPSLTRGVEATAIKKSTPVEGQPNKLEALVYTGGVEGANESTACDVVVNLAATVAPAGDANSKTVTWTMEMVSAWADSVDNIKDTIITLVDELIDAGRNPQDYKVDVILVKRLIPTTVGTQSVRAFFAPWVKVGAGCNI